MGRGPMDPSLSPLLSGYTGTPISTRSLPILLLFIFPLRIPLLGVPSIAPPLSFSVQTLKRLACFVSITERAPRPELSPRNASKLTAGLDFAPRRATVAFPHRRIHSQYQNVLVLLPLLRAATAGCAATFQQCRRVCERITRKRCGLSLYALVGTYSFYVPSHQASSKVSWGSTESHSPVELLPRFRRKLIAPSILFRVKGDALEREG